MRVWQRRRGILLLMCDSSRQITWSQVLTVRLYAAISISFILTKLGRDEPHATKVRANTLNRMFFIDSLISYTFFYASLLARTQHHQSTSSIAFAHYSHAVQIGIQLWNLASWGAGINEFTISACSDWYCIPSFAKYRLAKPPRQPPQSIARHSDINHSNTLISA